MLFILAVLLIIAKRKYKEKGTTGTLVILYSFILSTVLGIVFRILYPNYVGQYSLFSMLYYLICLFLFFVPLLKNNIGWESFYFPENSTRIMSIILIIGGFVVLYSSFVNFLTQDFSLIMSVLVKLAITGVLFIIFWYKYKSMILGFVNAIRKRK